MEHLKLCYVFTPSGRREVDVPRSENMNQELMPILTSISKLPIDAFQFDRKNDSIKMNFSKSETAEVNEIIFNKVTSFYYKDHDSQGEEHITENLNTIMYCGDRPYDFFDLPEDEDTLVSVPNFIIELNESNIFIEAQSIVINKEHYKL